LADVCEAIFKRIDVLRKLNSENIVFHAEKLLSAAKKRDLEKVAIHSTELLENLGYENGLDDAEESAKRVCEIIE